MKRRARSLIKTGTTLAIAVTLGSYVYIQTKDVTGGPRVTVENPPEGIAEESFIYIEGEADNIAWMSINNRAVFTDKSGRFKEVQVLLPGYNTINIEAGDRYGKRATKEIRVYHTRNKPISSS